MTHRPIAYNLVCGILGSLHTTPRGIERIDYGWLSHLFENWPSETVGVLPTPWGMRYYPRERVLRGRDRQARIWKEAIDGEHDPAFGRLKQRFQDTTIDSWSSMQQRDTVDFAGYWRAAMHLIGEGLELGKPVAALPERTLYIDIGHNGLSYPWMLKWLTKRRDVSPVFMVHDAIPFELPEVVTRKSVATHTTIIGSTAKYARAVIVPTQDAGRSVGNELENLGAHGIPIHPVPLPIDRNFDTHVSSDPDFGSHPYFLVCGAIEARKNQMLLINIWRDLVNKLGDRAPRLIMAGRPGHGAQDILEQLKRSRALRHHVLPASGLSTPAMAKLMAGARALLMPSFAEGFGLPPIEALSVGTPAILSDIPAHREAAGSYGIFIDPTDGPGWRTQIEAMMEDTEEYLALKRRIADFKPLDWPGYMGQIETILQNIA